MSSPAAVRRYRVVAPKVSVKTNTDDGWTVARDYRTGSVLPIDVPPDDLDALFTAGMIEVVSGDSHD